jgi:hypothetical protein
MNRCLRSSGSALLAVRNSRSRQSSPACHRFASDVLWLPVLLMVSCCGITVAAGQQGLIQTKFPVKFVTPDSVYLQAGRDAGLAEGQHLTIRRENPDESGTTVGGTAEIRIVSVASSSAVAEILTSDLEIRAGDTAYLSVEDVAKLKLLQADRDSRKYPQVVTFTEGDPLDEEVREYIPRPPLPEVNRIQARVGLEYNSIQDHSSGVNSNQLGFVLRADMTRLGGTYWNLSGYYRGRLTSRTTVASKLTLNDLISRTYHLSLTYNNPASHWVAGFGRFYLPWAASLSTIDGGYVGRRIGTRATVGFFGGSAPDPTSWNYDPNRQMAGGFVNFEGGSFESFRYSTTAGLALTRVNWHPDRQFAFFETGIFYKQFLAIYHNLEADLLRNDIPPDNLDGWQSSGPVLSRNYLTVRVQPHRIISFDISENYFRNIPTFDFRLVSTGLLDRFLFQGLSGSCRLELPYRIGLYAGLGRSNRQGDSRNSWNQMYGITFGKIWRTGIRADARYSKFDSAFGSGSYRSLFFTREIGESIRIEVQAGQQTLVSSMTSEDFAWWLTANFDWFLGLHYFLGGGYTIYRGRVQDYDQWFVNLGYRF